MFFLKKVAVLKCLHINLLLEINETSIIERAIKSYSRIVHTVTQLLVTQKENLHWKSLANPQLTNQKN